MDDVVEHRGVEAGKHFDPDADHLADEFEAFLDFRFPQELDASLLRIAPNDNPVKTQGDVDFIEEIHDLLGHQHHGEHIDDAADQVGKTDLFRIFRH